MLIQGFLFETVRRVGAGVLGLAFLWQVSERVGRRDGEAVIHLAEPNVVVRIDGYTYSSEMEIGTPTVCTLRPGRHQFTVSREGRTLYEENFTLDPGGQAILTARDGTRPTLPQKPRSSAERW